MYVRTYIRTYYDLLLNSSVKRIHELNHMNDELNQDEQIDDFKIATKENKNTTMSFFIFV